MIEAYAFLATFAMQILAVSVLHPAWLRSSVRAKATEFPAERFARLYPVYPAVDPAKTLERYLTLYRVANVVIAVLGLLVLGWLFTYLRLPDWDAGLVKSLVTAYFAVQVLPLCFAAWMEIRYKKLLGHLLEGKRTAVLQRRGLFDFVSPFTILVAVLGYFVCATYLIYVAQNPFPGFAGALGNIGILTLVYASQAFAVYRMLYSRKVNPVETHSARMHTIGMGVKTCVYLCIAFVVMVSLNLTLKLQDLQRWEPFALSLFLVFIALLMFMALTLPPRRPEADGLGASPAS